MQHFHSSILLLCKFFLITSSAITRDPLYITASNFNPITFLHMSQSPFRNLKKFGLLDIIDGADICREDVVVNQLLPALAGHRDLNEAGEPTLEAVMDGSHSGESPGINVRFAYHGQRGSSIATHEKTRG